MSELSEKMSEDVPEYDAGGPLPAKSSFAALLVLRDEWERLQRELGDAHQSLRGWPSENLDGTAANLADRITDALEVQETTAEILRHARDAAITKAEAAEQDRTEVAAQLVTAIHRAMKAEREWDAAIKRAEAAEIELAGKRAEAQELTTRVQDYRHEWRQAEQTADKAIGALKDDCDIILRERARADAAERERDDLRALAGQLREALEWYADPDHYEDRDQRLGDCAYWCSDAELDCGARAREARGGVQVRTGACSDCNQCANRYSSSDDSNGNPGYRCGWLPCPYLGSVLPEHCLFEGKVPVQECAEMCPGCKEKAVESLAVVWAEVDRVTGERDAAIQRAEAAELQQAIPLLATVLAVEGERDAAIKRAEAAKACSDDYRDTLARVSFLLCGDQGLSAEDAATQASQRLEAAEVKLAGKRTQIVELIARVQDYRAEWWKADAECKRLAVMEREVEVTHKLLSAERVKYTSSQDALRELQGEMREVCIILGGGDFAKDAITLAQTVKLAERLLRQAIADGYANHAPGCSGPFGASYPCKCGYREWRTEADKLLEAADD